MNRQQIQIGKAPTAVILFCALVFLTSAPVFALDLTPFDAPGAGTGASQGTYALAINPGGQIAGYYIDSNGLAHGFVRDRQGGFVTIDVAGADGVLGANVVAINQEGDATGYSFDASSVAHGFVRDHNGAITSFDAPGAVAGGLGTLPSGINADGTVTGTFADVNLVLHGFVRDRKGGLTMIDDPNAGTGLFQGSNALARNPSGAVVGCYVDTNGNNFNFLQTRSGASFTLLPPGGRSSFTCPGTAFSVLFASPDINDAGVVTGSYFEPLQNLFGGNERGFVRGLDGTFVTFDAVASPSTPCCTWTFPVSINSKGEIVGYDNDFETVNYAFLRETNGEVTVFDVPGAGTTPFMDQGTVAASINEAGTIAGYYVDSQNVAHGFMGTPN